MKVLVTGAAGFIGSNVSQYLEKKGIDVVALDDFSHSNYQNLLGLKADIIWGDITDQSLFSRLPKVAAVIHEAAITDTTLADDRKMMKVNYGGFKNVFAFCLSKKLPLVYASSAGVYGKQEKRMSEKEITTPHNTYAYSKYLCDRLVENQDKKRIPPVIGLRYFNVYGPKETHKNKAASMIYQLYKQMAAAKNPRLFKFGQQKRDFIYVKDVARITVECLNLNKPVISNLGTGNSRSFNDIVTIINGILAKKLTPEYIDNPYEAVYQNYTEADTRVLNEIVKNKAKYSLEEGIEDYLRILLNQPLQS